MDFYFEKETLENKIYEYTNFYLKCFYIIKEKAILIVIICANIQKQNKQTKI